MIFVLPYVRIKAHVPSQGMVRKYLLSIFLTALSVLIVGRFDDW